MQLSQILLTAIRLLDEDPQDIDEFRDLFVMYANMGYRIALEDYVKPRQERALKTDPDGRIYIIYSDVRRIVLMRDKETGREIPFDLSSDGKTALTREKNKEVIAVCEVTYPDMVKDDDEPNLPASAQAALADYVCYRHLSSGNLAKQSRAQFFLNAFFTAMQRIRPDGFGSVTRIKNLYSATDIRAR